MNAYRVTQSIWNAAGKAASYGQCGGGQCLYGPGTNVDATTIMLLANPANGYNHFVALYAVQSVVVADGDGFLATTAGPQGPELWESKDAGKSFSRVRLGKAD